VKVIETSNHNIDNYPEKQVSFNHLTKKQAEDLAEKFNRNLNGHSPIWHLVVDDDYVLCDGDPNS